MTPNSDPTVQPVPASVVHQVDAADTTLQNPKLAVLSIGSNIGDRLEKLQSAVDALADTPGLKVKAVSPVYETEPWGVDPGSQPAYLNAVVIVKTTLPPSSLLERGQAIEEALERVREQRWGARTMDVDMGLDTGPAAAGDDLTRTVHYGVVAEEVVAVIQGEPVDLIETLAQRIADTCLAHEAVREVEVVVHKPDAPIAVPFTDVTITIQRSRA